MSDNVPRVTLRQAPFHPEDWSFPASGCDRVDKKYSVPDSILPGAPGGCFIRHNPR